MANDQNELKELLGDFTVEVRELLDQLEPMVISWGKGVHFVNCWEVTDCKHDNCPRKNKNVEYPCWLEETICNANNKQNCYSCAVFSLRQGSLESLNGIFRIFHSLKGSSGFLGLTNIQKVAHIAENLLDHLRQGKILLERSHVDILMKVLDFFRDAVDSVEKSHSDEEHNEEAQNIVALLKEEIERSEKNIIKLKADVDSGKIKPQEVKNEIPDTVKEDQTLELNASEFTKNYILESIDYISKIEEQLLLIASEYTNKEKLNIIVSEIFRLIHSFKGNSAFLGFSDLEKILHKLETVFDTMRSGGYIEPNNLVKVTLGLVDVLKLKIQEINDNGSGGIEQMDLYLDLLNTLLPKEIATKEAPKAYPPIGEILVKQGAVDEKTLETALEQQKKNIGDILVDMGAVSKEQINAAAEEQSKLKPKLYVKEIKKPKIEEKILKQDIRVDLDKIDKLINLIGELVIAENMITHSTSFDSTTEQSKTLQQMTKTIRELQEVAMNIRMIPVSPLFKKMIRLVHDLSTKLGKKIELVLEGEDTEVDKTVVEIITDPLVHIVRNAIDHGIENVDQRKLSGKSEVGTIKLIAKHQEGEVWITIEDDGKGLNKDKILKKALTSGLIQEGATLTDKEIYDLIFMPGFSTAEKVTDVSGRGVGMDVVKKNLEKINGKIDIESKEGAGSKFHLRMPLTLGIIDGMLVKVNNSSYIIPILDIREFFKPTRDIVTRTPDGSELVKLRDSILKVVRIHDLHHVAYDKKPITDGCLLVIEVRGRKTALFVDEIIGQQQIVIKGLTQYFDSVKGFTGCTILGSGEVSLILDSTSIAA